MANYMHVPELTLSGHPRVELRESASHLKAVHIMRWCHAKGAVRLLCKRRGAGHDCMLHFPFQSPELARRIPAAGRGIGHSSHIVVDTFCTVLGASELWKLAN